MKPGLTAVCGALFLVLFTGCGNGPVQLPPDTTPPIVAPSYTFTSFDAPGATATQTEGISDSGATAGNQVFLKSGALTTHGYLLEGTAFSDLQFATSPYTSVTGISNGGNVLGIWTQSTGFQTGYTYNSIVRLFIAYQLIGANQVMPFGVNNSRTVVGCFGNDPNACFVTLSAGNGFEAPIGLSVATNIVYPGAYATYPSAINDADQIVGTYYDSAKAAHGFVNIGGIYTAINYPGAASTYANSINLSGEIVGTYDTGQAMGTHGFVYQNKTYTTVDYPGFAGTTWVNGVNSSGQIVGAYGRQVGGGVCDQRPDACCGAHGFTATPH